MPEPRHGLTWILFFQRVAGVCWVPLFRLACDIVSWVSCCKQVGDGLERKKGHVDGHGGLGDPERWRSDGLVMPVALPGLPLPPIT